MLIVRQTSEVLFVSVDQDMLVIRLSTVLLNLAVKILVEQTQSVIHRAEQQFADVLETTSEIPTPDALLTLVLLVHAEPMLSAKTTATLQFVNVHQDLKVTQMFHAEKIHVAVIHVVRTQNVRKVETKLSVDV